MPLKISTYLKVINGVCEHKHIKNVNYNVVNLHVKILPSAKHVHKMLNTSIRIFNRLILTLIKLHSLTNII